VRSEDHIHQTTAGGGKRLTREDIDDILRIPTTNPWDNV